jgi:hypothetical protein
LRSAWRTLRTADPFKESRKSRNLLESGNFVPGRNDPHYIFKQHSHVRILTAAQKQYTFGPAPPAIRQNYKLGFPWVFESLAALLFR